MSKSFPTLGLRGSRYLPEWLRQQEISIALTTYQTNRLFLVGTKPGGTLSGFERIFDRPMGLSVDVDGKRLTMATRYQIRELVDALPDGETYEGYDRVYVPRRAYTTGELDAHDVVRTQTGDILFVNTQFSCLARPSENASFQPVWKPAFLSQISPEDRCHLNGLATENGHPRFATAASCSDVASGWRARRYKGGVVIDIDTDEIVGRGLTMPHSPRIHNGKLYLLNAGTGELGHLNPSDGLFEPIAFCPGFARGLAFWKNYALVGTSKPRGDEVFQDLPLGRQLRQKDAEPRCGVFVIDLETGATAHWLEFISIVDELYDIQVLPKTNRPMALGFKTSEIGRFITIEDGDIAPAVPSQRFILALDSLTDSDSETTSSSEANRLGRDDFSTDSFPSLELPELARRQIQSRRVQGQSFGQLQAGTLTVAELLTRFGRILPRSLSRQMQSGHLRTDQTAWVIAATRKEHVLGVAVALPVDGGQQAEVRAVSVLPACRGQGLATAMIKRLEVVAAQNGRRRLFARFRSDNAILPALERIIEKCGWESPWVESYALKVDVGDVVAQGESSSLHRLDGIIPWGSTTTEQRESVERRILSGDVPKTHSPFNLSRPLLRAAVVVVCDHERIVGWAIPTRLSDHIAQMTVLHVDDAVSDSIHRIDVLIEALHRQHEATNIPTTLLTADPSDKAWIQALKQRLGDVLVGPTTLYITETDLLG